MTKMINFNTNIENLKKYKHIHMIGIGGISMSGIAEILRNFRNICYWF